MRMRDLDHGLYREMIAAAREFVRAPVSYHWTPREYLALVPFFSNVVHKVFFIERMPEAASTSLMAMYSRLKNPRGIRGNWVDSFLPSLLASLLPACENMDGKQILAWLKQNKITTLDAFCEFSPESDRLFELFIDTTLRGGVLMHRLATGERIRQFLQMWLDAFGHNSIARTGRVLFCYEDGSIIVIKILEWGRPAAGEIELSTRFVIVSSKGQYPFEREMALISRAVAELAARYRDQSMDLYRRLMGDNLDGAFPAFLRSLWAGVVPDDSLAAGVQGESCDVLGNLIPSSTLTSVGVASSAEAFPEHIKHLLLDGPPEGVALAEFLIEEAQRIGFGGFIRHEQPTPWEIANWHYLPPSVPACLFMAPSDDYVQRVLQRVYGEGSFSRVLERVTEAPRCVHDKLPSQFESSDANVWGVMTFRGWRDWQRMSFCSHLRGRVTPLIGFYQYPKPAPPELSEAFRRVHAMNEELYRKMGAVKFPEELAEYPMALGNLIPYHSAANLRQWEFCTWQRSSWSVNDEVRTEFLKAEHALRNQYPWWGSLSRANLTPHYVFARGKTPVILP